MFLHISYSEIWQICRFYTNDAEKDTIVKTPTQHNTMVGFDNKMTLHTPPTETQCQQYLSCCWPNFDETLKVASWEHLEQIPTIKLTFV